MQQIFNAKTQSHEGAKIRIDSWQWLDTHSLVKSFSTKILIAALRLCVKSLFPYCIDTVVERVNRIQR